jgi:hypothetical protein
MRNKTELIEWSWRFLERQGYLVAPPGDGAKLLLGDLVAIDPLKRFVVVWVTTPLQAFDLWLELLGDEMIQHALNHPGGGFLHFQVHKWSTGVDGENVCDASEITTADWVQL